MERANNIDEFITILIGNSHVSSFRMPSVPSTVISQGISGGTLQDIDVHAKFNCHHIHIHCGENDVSDSKTPLDIAATIMEIAKIIKVRHPLALVTIGALIQQQGVPRKVSTLDTMNLIIRAINDKLGKMCHKKGIRLIRIPQDIAQNMDNSGVHLNVEGCEWYMNTIRQIGWSLYNRQ